VSHILFLKLRKRWASQKLLMHIFFKKKDVAHLKVNTHLNTPLATYIDDTMTDNRPTKSLRIEPMKDRRRAQLQWKMLSHFLNICYRCLH
jgi:hypothetical protein